MLHSPEHVSVMDWQAAYLADCSKFHIAGSASACARDVVGARAYPLYLSVVSPAIHAPYVFSDHANKAFDRQHAYLKRTSPELWERDWTHPEMELAVKRALDQRGVAPDVCARVVALAHDADRAIVRAMALATTAARALHN